VVGCFGKMSGTYWIVVIRPQLSRTATTVWHTSNRLIIPILDGPVHVTLAF
jgi:hypothetical protein